MERREVGQHLARHGDATESGRAEFWNVEEKGDEEAENDTERSDGEQARELDGVLIEASEGERDGSLDARREDERRQEVCEKSARAVSPLESPARKSGGKSE